MLKKRKLIVSIGIVVAVIVLGVVCLMHTEVGKGEKDCVKCGLHMSYRYVRLFGLPLISEETKTYSGTPHLKSVQQTCSHECVRRGRWGPLLGAREIGHSSVPYIRVWAILAEQGGMELIVDELMSERAELRDEAAWFIQQATPSDFGIRWDDKEHRPIVPEGAIEKILTWWEEQGRDLYGLPDTQP